MPILPLSVLLLALWAGCGREERFQLPPDLGRGLPPADSLRTILNWLSQQKSYVAETLRFHYMYEYIWTLARQKPDTLPALTQELRSWAQKSQYLLGEGTAALGEAVRWRSQGQYDSALSRAQVALRIFSGKRALGLRREGLQQHRHDPLSSGAICRSLRILSESPRHPRTHRRPTRNSHLVQQHRQHPRQAKAACRGLRSLPKSPRHPRTYR